MVPILSKIKDRNLFILLLLLAIPAFTLNLGLIPFIGDEGIRSLVALEMHLSGDYLVPTMNGETYLNKPPLYNWIILLFSKLFGFFGEIPARSATLFFLGLFAFWVFRYTRKELGFYSAAAGALMLLTCGRILFWDSMLGLIDIGFSALIYLNFMLLYTLGKKGKWMAFFITSYALCAAGFLLKGLPAVVFQAISIPIALVLHGELKRRFFSLKHILGGLVFLILAGAYYVLYAREVSLQTAFAVLLDQSLQRTATHHGIGKTIGHLFTFPFDSVYHFLPWSLLILLLFQPRFRQWIGENDFVKFNFWMLAANLPIYWSSVQVYPRYLLMFVPLFNTICLYAWQQTPESHWSRRILQTTFPLAGAIVLVAVLLSPLYPRLHTLPGGLWLSWLAVVAPLGFSVWGLWTDKPRVFFWLVGALLAVRIGLDLLVLPFRNEDLFTHDTRADAQRIVAEHPTSQLWFWRDTVRDNVVRFYLTEASGYIIRRTDTLHNPGDLYISQPTYARDYPGVIIDSVRSEGGKFLPIFR